jgi:subtilisin-like proprotein convertase family protein
MWERPSDPIKPSCRRHHQEAGLPFGIVTSPSSRAGAVALVALALVLGDPGLLASGVVARAAQAAVDPLLPAPGHDVVTAPAGALGAPIPDPGALTTTLTAETFGTIVDLDVAVELDHGDIGQVALALRHVPSGETVELLAGALTTTGQACTGDDLLVVFDSVAGSPPAATGCNDGERPTLTGRLAPVESLDAFTGENLSGTWELTVTDTTAGATGRVVAWSLHAAIDLGGFDVAVVASDIAPARRLEVVNHLAADPRIATVTSLADEPSALTPAALDRFEAVVAWTRVRPSDPVAVGDALADYVDRGGGVVLAGFASLPALGFAGRIAATDHAALAAGTDFDLVSPASLVGVESHPVLEQVLTLSAPSRVTGVTPVRGAMLVAQWSDDAATPLAVARTLPLGRVVALNLFPVSDLLDIVGYAAGTDAPRLLANAAVWAGRPVEPCDRLAPTIEGTVGDDVLVGTPGDDVIVGYGGDDRIAGLAGDDILCGGPGHDVLDGGDGSDRLLGGRGGDTAAGGRGPDALLGGKGVDQVRFGPVAGVRVDLAAGSARGEGLDELHDIEDVRGTAGDDVLRGDSERNHLLGRGGDDALVGAGRADVLDGGPGTDRADGGPGPDRCRAETRLSCGRVVPR